MVLIANVAFVFLAKPPKVSRINFKVAVLLKLILVGVLIEHKFWMIDMPGQNELVDVTIFRPA